MKKLITASLIIIAIVALFFLVEVVLFLNSRPSSQKNERIISVPRGASFLRVAKQLKSKGIVTNDIKFYLLARFKKSVHIIKAGEYQFYTNLKPLEVLSALVEGKTYLHKILVPEGYNIYQISDVLNQAKLITKESFLRVCKDSTFLKKQGISGPSVEGYLFPESYFFSKPVTPEKIIKTMVSRFRENFTDEMGFQAKKRGFSEYDVVILASIIEKETGVSRERRLISAVLHNRLKKKMKLFMDPTVIYGIYESFKGNLTKKHLRTKTPYNTYVIEGLPAGPIANPGKAALEAAVNPAPVDYLYFVARGDGSHFFSSTLRDHINAVNRYQKRRKKK